VNVNRKKPNRLSLISQLKSDLSNNEQIIDILFGLLSNSNQNTGDAIWELIKFLPVNMKVKNDIIQLNIDGSEVFSFFFRNFLDFYN